MPAAAAHNGFDPERFAALWAGCDTGNNNEAEAVNKFRALRRMVAGNNLRIVDCVTGRDDVMHALDAQLKPVRKDSAELAAAFVEIAKLADLAKERAEIINELRRNSGGSARGSPAMSGPPRVSETGPVHEYLGGVFAFVFVMVAAALLFVGGCRLAAAVFGG